MLTKEEKNMILVLKSKGHTNTFIAETLKRSRTTVIKYLRENAEDREKLKEVEAGSVEYHRLQEKISGPPEYKGKYKERMKKKYTPEIDKRIDEILEDEKRKDRTYGPNHKLKRTAKQIHQILLDENYDIGYSTVCNAVRKKREKARETFIKQEYDFGERLEFDFGQRKLTIAGKVTKVYVAVLACPFSKYVDYYVYLDSKTQVFLDAHVRFFKRLGGVYQNVVYDNMKNVVKRFVGRNERELTDAVISLSSYYCFDIGLTNPYRGNEKGTVEVSVKKVTSQLFANRDQFESFEDLIDYVRESKEEMNKNSRVEEEKDYLLECPPPLEIGIISEHRVNKYAFVRVENNDYSVPEEYNGANVTVKVYPLSVEIFHRGKLIARHVRLRGKNELSVDIRHYYKTMLRKPGALKHSVALKQAPQLKKLFDKYYTNNPRLFLEILIDNRDLCDIDKLEKLLTPDLSPDSESGITKLEECTQEQLAELVSLFGGNNEEH